MTKVVRNLKETAEAFRHILERDEPGFIARLGGDEYDFTVLHFLMGVTSRRATERLHRYNGYYDTSEDRDIKAENLKTLYTTLRGAAEGADFATLVGRLRTQSGFLTGVISDSPQGKYLKSLGLPEVHAYDYIDTYAFRSLLPLLEGKTILLVSPFCDEMMDQYATKSKVLFNDGPMPTFTLKGLKTYVTYNDMRDKDAVFPHGSTLETLEVLKERMNELEFDVALLGCGLYANPLGFHAKCLGKKAIYMGGALQVYFGVLGNRYRKVHHRVPLRKNLCIQPRTPPPNTFRIEGREAIQAYW